MKIIIPYKIIHLAELKSFSLSLKKHEFFILKQPVPKDVLKKCPNVHFIEEPIDWDKYDLGIELWEIIKWIGRNQLWETPIPQIIRSYGTPICDKTLPKEKRYIPITYANYYPLISQKYPSKPYETCEGKILGTPIYECRDFNFWKGWIGKKKCVLIVMHPGGERAGPFGGLDIMEALKKQNIAVNWFYGNAGWAGSRWKGVSEIEYLRLYQEARVYGMFSKRVFSSTAIDAMTLGVPIIARKLPYSDSRFLIKENITGFQAETIKDWIQYAKLLFNDYNLAKEISEHERNLAKKIYDPKKIGKKWDRIIEKAIQGWNKI